MTPEAGVPNAGVTSVGLVAKTAAPDPVSSVNAVASCDDVNEPSTAAFPTDVTWPVKLALVVTVLAVLALPVNAAVMVPALKLPEASRATIAEAVLAFVAVVALLLTLSAVLIVANLVSTIAAEALMSAFRIVPSRIIVEVTVPVSPVVITVPVTLGSVIVLSAVGSTTVSNVS